MKINIERLLNDFKIVNSYTKTPNNGCTRFSYSYEDKQVRTYLISQMENLGLSIKIDAIGNIRAKYGGNLNKPSVMIGSHIDTVKNGGRFDGITGVLAALEVIRVMKKTKIEPIKPVELIIFAEEEGSNFGITMLGSKILTGQYNLEQLNHIKDGEGNSIFDVTKKFNLKIENMKKDILKSEEVDSMIELHIEQGAVLEKKNKSIGVIQAIAGMKTLKVTLEGDSNHAGTTPMDLRHDPLVGAAEIVTNIQKKIKEKAYFTTVATVGKIICQPNISNVIPHKVEFFVDVRDVNKNKIDILSQEIETIVNRATETHSLKSNIQLIGESKSVKLSSKIIKQIEKTTEEMGYSYLKMNSGAVHDAAMLTDVTNVGMIFIPSIGGKSHCPEEFTKEEDIEKGSNLLLNTVVKLANKTQ